MFSTPTWRLTQSAISRLSALAAIVALTLSGCAVTPSALTKEEIGQQIQAVQTRMFATQEKIDAPLTLAQATARAVRYNMDVRIRMMEEAVALGQSQLANFDLLPKATASAGYTTRSNDSFGFGFNQDGTISANPTASQERSHYTTSIGFAWNALDFGLSYVRAKQLADQSLVTEERRRKALQNLVQDVRFAWWRAEAAQRLLPQIDALIEEIDQAGARAKLIESRRLLPPLQIVSYRRSLLDLQQQLSLRRQELAQAQIELAALMNLAPGTRYSLAEANSLAFAAPVLSARLEALEAVALENRPELREEAYKTRINDLEWKKQLLAVLPGIGLDMSFNTDSNRYLLNNQWAAGGINLSFHLLKLLSLPTMNRTQEAQAKTDEARRLATAAAILAQTRMAAVRYDLLAHEFGIWDEAMKDDARIVEYLGSAKQVGLDTELELIRAKARSLVSRVQRDSVHANLQATMGRLYNSIGLDSLPREMDSTDAASLAQMLEERVTGWEKATFSDKTKIILAPFAIAPVVGLPPQSAPQFEQAMQRVLRLSKLPVAAPGQADYTLQASVELAPRQDSGRPSRLRVTLVDASGKVIASSEQNAMLVEPVGNDQWQVLGEGAGYRMIEPLRKALRMPAAANANDANAANAASNAATTDRPQAESSAEPRRSPLQLQLAYQIEQPQEARDLLSAMSQNTVKP